jgi:hypothetical protein
LTDDQRLNYPRGEQSKISIKCAGDLRGFGSYAGWRISNIEQGMWKNQRGENSNKNVRFLLNKKGEFGIILTRQTNGGQARQRRTTPEAGKPRK